MSMPSKTNKTAAWTSTRWKPVIEHAVRHKRDSWTWPWNATRPTRRANAKQGAVLLVVGINQEGQHVSTFGPGSHTIKNGRLFFTKNVFVLNRAISPTPCKSKISSEMAKTGEGTCIVRIHHGAVNKILASQTCWNGSGAHHTPHGVGVHVNVSIVSAHDVMRNNPARR